MLTASALLWTRIAAGVCLFVVANLAYGLWRSGRQVSAGRGWPRTAGKIIVSKVSHSAIVSSEERANSSVDLRYSYRVAGKDYEAARVRFGGRASLTSMAADAMAARYPQGASVDVYYDPKAPSRAVLEPGNSSNKTGLIVFLVVFSMIAAVLVAHSIAGKVLTTAGGFPLFGLLLPLSAVLIGLAAFVQYFIRRRQASASTRWPSTPGRITLADIAMEQRTENDDDSSRPTRTIRLYRPDLRFSYAVDGREFHGSTWRWGWTALHSDEASARKEIAKYAVGAQVPVFYDPAQPETAVLEPANRSGSAATLVFGGLFVIGGALMFWVFATTGGWR